MSKYTVYTTQKKLVVAGILLSCIIFGSLFTTIQATSYTNDLDEVSKTVQITASVAPQITFLISGVTSGSTICNTTTNASTSAFIVPLSQLSDTSFTNAAQLFTISTNDPKGYVVTAKQSDQLGRDAGSCIGDYSGSDCIPDATGNNSLMSHTISDSWDSPLYKGFGFSLDNSSRTGPTPEFEFNLDTGYCSGGTFCARQFADAEDLEYSHPLFSSTSISTNHNLFVCYRAVTPENQAQGTYRNTIIYTATTIF